VRVRINTTENMAGTREPEEDSFSSVSRLPSRRTLVFVVILHHRFHVKKESTFDTKKDVGKPAAAAATVKSDNTMTIEGRF